MIHYRPFWLARLPKSQRPTYPRFRGPMVTEVAIVGGGLTGCSVAYLLAAAGIKTSLFEAGQLGQGSTAAASGAVRPQPVASFEALQAAYGRRAARQMCEMSRRAALDFAALLRRLRVRCDLEPRDWLSIARTSADERDLQREYRASEVAGLDAVWFRSARLSKEAALEGRGALRLQGAAQIDPYRACLGLAKAAAARGARIFERSPVLRVRSDRAGVEIETDGGSVAAHVVVVATNAPGALFEPLGRHFALRHTYLVATPPLEASLRKEMGRRDIVLNDTAQPARTLSWTRDDRVLFTGADQAQVADRRRPKVLVQRTGQLMYELSLLYPAISGIQPDCGWDSVVAQASDGLIVAGPHRNYPHHLFALGCGHNGPAAALLAGRILFRHHTGAPEPGDELFGFGRR
jgi:glycine/D-amino acid oxidase-like deaminating enzyme